MSAPQQSVTPVTATEAISENFSEKPKRGRPTADGGVIKMLERITGPLPGKSSRRSKLNFYYLMAARKALEEAPDHQSRWPKLAIVNGDYPKQYAVLYELGRVEDPAAIRWLADQLCTDAKFSATEIVRRIRAWRLGKPILPSADAEELAIQLVETLVQHAQTHAGLTEEIVVDAWDTALAVWRGGL
jgi:hypothetical protein